MKKLLLLALCSSFISTAHALDSDWKLCKGDVILYDDMVNLVVNVYEHRNGNGRAADLTVIYGGHVLRGSYSTTESTTGEVKLKGTKSSFKGVAAVDYGRGILDLKGVILLNNSASALNANLQCETL